MRLLILFSLIFIFYLPILKKEVNAQASSSGIDSEEGDAEELFNKTYSEHQTNLEQKIFRGYSPKSRPVRNGSVPTVVDVHWHIIHVSINQKEQTMTIHGHIYMRWFDEFLVWDPKDFAGITYARVKKWQVWQPKIKVSNSASGLGSAFDFSTSAHVIIQMVEKDRAKVEMYPTFSIKVGCIFDFADYPNDKNKCSVNLFSTQTMAEVQLQNLYSIPPTLSFGWEDQRSKRIISDFNIKNVSCSSFFYSAGNVTKTAPVTGFDLGNTWSMLAVNVEFERYAPLYWATILMPSVVTAVLCQSSFYIPDKNMLLPVLVTISYIQIIFLTDMATPLPLAISRIPTCISLYTIILISNSVCIFGMGILHGLSFTKFPVPLSFTKIYFVNQYLPFLLRTRTEGKDTEKFASWDEFNKVFRPCVAFLLIFYYWAIFILFFIASF